MSPKAETLASRSEAELRQRQQRGELRVRSAEEYRHLVERLGLAEAYGCTDVVVASNAELTDQATLLLQLGPSDPPLRVQRFRIGAAEGFGGHGNSDLVLPLSGGGAGVLGQLLAGRQVSFSASGAATSQQPRQELDTHLGLDQIGAGQLLLHRGISENGVVALSSREGLTATPWGPVLGPFASALYSCGGSGSIGLTMPGLSLLGPGSPVLVGGALGWVSGAGSGHNPAPRRQASGHARSPGASCALSVNLHALRPEWVRSADLGEGCSALLVAVAAPVPLINQTVAQQAACGDAELEAPLLDFGIPRRVKPSFGTAPYDAIKAGLLQLQGQPLRCAPAHSPRLAAAIAEELVRQLHDGRFPLRLPLAPLPERPALLPLD